MIPPTVRSLRYSLRKPRASGDDPAANNAFKRAAYVNPARAGMIRTRTLLVPSRPGKPRASGDDPGEDTVGVRALW